MRATAEPRPVSAVPCRARSRESSGASRAVARSVRAARREVNNGPVRHASHYSLWRISTQRRAAPARHGPDASDAGGSGLARSSEGRAYRIPVFVLVV